MIPRSIIAQSYFTRKGWGDTTTLIEEYWDKGYVVTDFDYGNGFYFVVMSKVNGWNRQKLFYGNSLPTDDIKEAWDRGYYITNVLHDGSDWIVIMTEVDYCTTQRLFSTGVWEDFKEKIQNGWDEDMLVTKLCCEKQRFSTYFAAMTEFNDGSPAQSARYLSGSIIKSDLDDLFVDGKYIVDIFDFDGGAYVVTAGDTGWSSHRLFMSPSLNSTYEAIKDYWDRGYYITTISFYDGEWILVFGKE